MKSLSLLAAALLSGGFVFAQETVAPISTVTSSSEPLTLSRAFELASANNERLDIQAEEIEQTKALYRQTRGGILPNIRFNYSTTIQDTPPAQRNDDGEDVQSTLNQRRRSEAKFTARQPLFQGFKEFAALSALKANENATRLRFQREATLLFQDVATAFYRVVALETELSDLQALMKLSGDRIGELKERTRLGKSRNTETTTAESQFAVYRAQEANLRGEIVAARENLSFLIGVRVDMRPLVDSIVTPDQPPAVDELLGRLPDRSDLAALREDVRAREAGIRVARAGYWPALVASGNYYVDRPSGFQEDIDWDVLFSLDVPIYQGGAVRAFHEEAKSLLRQSRRTLDQQMRLGESQVRQAHAALASSLEESRLLDDANKKSRRSFDLLTREYRLGLVNNLEVLQALNDLQNVKRDFDLALIQSKLDLLNLRLAVELTPQALP